MSDDMLIIMIVAMDETKIIGKEGAIPWRLSKDMKRFRKRTVGSGNNSVIMGRKTWDSLPVNFRPLPNRINIVLTRETDWKSKGALNALYPGRAIEIAYSEACEECWIIGGSEIYNLFIDLVDEIHITEVHTKNSGDVPFCNWNSNDWEQTIIEEVPKDEIEEFASTYSIWKRNN